MEPELKSGQRRRPVRRLFWIVVGVLIGVAGTAGFERALLSEPQEPKVVDIVCMPTRFELSGRSTEQGVLVRVYDNGYAYPGLLLDPADESARSGEVNGLQYNFDLCIP
jgi:hypothetical protein